MKRLRLRLSSLACLAVLAAACNGSSTSPTADLSASSMPDLLASRDLAPPADLAPGDLAPPEDLTPPEDLRRAPDLVAVGECQVDGDCRLFSSYCSTQPCMCLPLPKGRPDPTCLGNMVACFMDPCTNKKAACENHTCVVR